MQTIDPKDSNQTRPEKPSLASDRMDIGYGELYGIAEQHRDAALLHFAHSSGIFELLQVPRSIDEISTAQDWIPRKTAVLLNALSALKLVHRSGEKYENVPVVKESLVRSSPKYIGSYLQILHHQWMVWTQLPNIMRSESHVPGQQNLDSVEGDKFIATFQDAMSQVCDGDISGLLSGGHWKKNDHVLDLGGGHGLYLAMLALQFPGITGEVWDLDSARESALNTFRRLGVEERLTFRCVDLTRIQSIPPRKADVVMINHCLHHLAPSYAEGLLRFSRKLLNPCGRLIVIDQNLDADGDRPMQSALFSFYLMANNATGQLHPIPWIEGILRNCDLDVTISQCGWEMEDVMLVGMLGPTVEVL